ncbi:selenocysteine-specific translation elongation factor [Candidatus Lucifugimonas marina]|uniref:Selenocysteine-specific elongation factor n=1 Tax=Candidatus Lucifugimonas marina TaxID=3038979 RepID=A0AAJ5ZGM6_9CHLR|nr:selenocysteine-specific translation elongation factor [SAR202 cluster bacterium JH702]MDG0869154.1 selenocysteine-specific translation elongation factor [SAR202 cluster bacterium JH639]WFG35774.1 selenocysteine-specific translation elongation factor [SAR202 cluster bacterium JH545]WFG39719.1 selenocysteine-specific translation elongation factor [SAR202 cluster bacterium JH1073]
MFVVGTAGHVDHGKSTLIQALTGIDPDRLREEKNRGMTIELGFAWLELPSGAEISIVDVPGHERFIKNMLMGAGGVDVALLIVAADEGVMPQTREHMAILDLLGIETGIVVMTKKDLVDQDWLDLVTLDVQEALEGTSLENAEVVAVSAENGDGLDELRSTLDKLISELPSHQSTGNPRLPVDRSFTITGFGAVVTGTLADGSLKTGQEVEILPSGLRARIRSLQVHEESLDQVGPGTRLAVNLSGIDHSDIQRGDLVTSVGWLESATAFDATFRVIPDAPRPVRHNHKVTLFAGTREVPATIRVLEGDQIIPGFSGWVQVRTQEKIPVVRGDSFVVRDTENTLGGGHVLEPNAPRRKRNDAATISVLETIASGSSEDVVFNALTGIEPATAAQLSGATGTNSSEIKDALSTLETQGRVRFLGEDSSFVMSVGGWQNLVNTASSTLSSFHKTYPLRQGMPLQDFRGQLKLKSAAFNAVTDSLKSEDVIATNEATVGIPNHQPALSVDQEAEASAFLKLIAADRFSPSTEQPINIEILQFLSERGDVVRISGDIVYPADAYDEMESKIIESGRDGQEISITSVRAIFGTSRKYTLAVLEHMDSKGLTRRSGDARFLR